MVSEMDPHVVLYFDVNKTVIMHDPVQGKGLHHILNDLLTERALGIVSADGETWTWNGKKVVVESPIDQPSSVAGTTYGAFLRTKYPMSSDPAESKRNKKMRKLLRQDFTSPGNPGEGFAHEHDALLERLQLPAHEEGDERVVAAGLHELPYHFIIPAFFRLVQFLHDGGTRFNLVFRTYGDDLHRIAQEFNLFCSGKHPFYSPGSSLMDGSNGTVDRRLHLSRSNGSEQHRYGTFYRSEGDTALVLGTFQQPKTIEDDFRRFYAAVPGIQVVQGVENIHNFLTKAWQSTQATLAIRDFYPFWFSKKEDATAGKLMTIDPDDPNLHTIFFDDNILRHEPHIVDARRHPDGTAMMWEETRDLYLMRVEPLEAVRNVNYFIDRYTKSLERKLAKHSNS